MKRPMAEIVADLVYGHLEALYAIVFVPLSSLLGGGNGPTKMTMWVRRRRQERDDDDWASVPGVATMTMAKKGSVQDAGDGIYCTGLNGLILCRLRSRRALF